MSARFFKNLPPGCCSSDLPDNDPSICPTCEGAGTVLIDEGLEEITKICPHCNGYGKIHKD